MLRVLASWACALSLLAGGMVVHAQDMSAVMGKAAATDFVLEPGEGLAVGVQGGEFKGYGEARKVAPMGSLAKLLWLQMYGDEWGYNSLTFTCKGTWNGFPCWLKKGHGRVDLAKALEESCNLAFLAWASQSVMQSKAQDGDDVTRARLEDVFRPFMGSRLKPGEPLPPFGPAWIGDGELLQTSPEQMARWLLDPGQERVVAKAANLLLPFLRAPGPRWWFKTGTAPVPGEPGATSAWVAGSDGMRVAVLHMPRGRGKAEGIARFCALLGIRKR